MSEVKGKPGGQAEVGQVLEFKHPYQFDLYGPYATVTRRTVTVDRPLSTRTRDWIDLISANGTLIQWSAGNVTYNFKRF